MLLPVVKATFIGFKFLNHHQLPPYLQTIGGFFFSERWFPVLAITSI
jgi:hypothetical protein